MFYYALGMKGKWLWIVLALILLVGLGVFGYRKFAAHKTLPVAKEEERGGVFSSIQDALMKNLSLQCQFTSDDGVTTVAYIKAGAIRVDNNVGKPDAASMILKDKKIYFWQVASKTGTVMAVPSITITPAPTVKVEIHTTAAPQKEEGADAMSMLEKFKNSCKTATVADSLFVPPADVKFTDTSELIKNTAPSGVPLGMNSEQIKQLMQKYATPTGY